MMQTVMKTLTQSYWHEWLLRDLWAQRTIYPLTTSKYPVLEEDLSVILSLYLPPLLSTSQSSFSGFSSYMCCPSGVLLPDPIYPHYTQGPHHHLGHLWLSSSFVPSLHHISGPTLTTIYTLAPIVTVRAAAVYFHATICPSLPFVFICRLGENGSFVLDNQISWVISTFSRSAF